jgi:hypothetical protein
MVVDHETLRRRMLAEHLWSRRKEKQHCQTKAAQGTLWRAGADGWAEVEMKRNATSMFDGKGRVNCWTCHRSQPKPPPLPMPATIPAERVAAEQLIALTPEQAAKPAEEVFHNIKAMRGVPAGQFPMIMAYFSRSLGVHCTFCHNLDDFPSDGKPPKQMAQDARHGPRHFAEVLQRLRHADPMLELPCREP